MSASTFETPRLLLHSGIQGRAIGHYLTNHSSISSMGKMSRKEFPEVLGTLGILIPGTAAKHYQIQLRDLKLLIGISQEKPLLEELGFVSSFPVALNPDLQGDTRSHPYDFH